MTILEQINYDLYETTKKQETNKRDDLRLLLGEVQRSPIKLEHDVDIIKIMKQLKKGSETMLEHNVDSRLIDFIDLLNGYLPQPISESEIEDWMRVNINFDALKNIKQAIGITMKHFGESADGKIVNNVLNKIIG